MSQTTRVLALALAAAFAGCAPSSERQLEENKAIVGQFTEVLNAADFDALDELVTEDFRRHSQATGEVRVNSREEFKELQRSFLTSMPDQRVTIQMMIAEGDKVAGKAGERERAGQAVEWADQFADDAGLRADQRELIERLRAAVSEGN